MIKYTLFLVFCFVAFFTQGQSPLTFNYTGSVQNYTVPSCVTSIVVDIQGAQGGSGPVGCNSYQGTGGLGGRIQAVINVTPGDVLSIYVGGAGTNDNNTSAAGGFNGGGNAMPEPSYTYYGGGGGGGASDIRLNGVSLANRIVVAGGGGGAGADGCTCGGLDGGSGGGLIAAPGTPGPICSCNPSGQGGTQSAGGAKGDWGCSCDATAGTLGQGGNSNTSSCGGPTGGGGGGGGYYGGGGGGLGSGGGGSNYVVPAATSVVNTQGFKSGDGLVVITPVTGVVSPGSISGSAVSICANSSANYSVAPLSGATSYSWTAPIGTTINSGQGTNAINLTAGSTSGNLSVTATFSCGTSPSTTMALTINPLPVISVNSGSICNTQSFTINPSGASTYTISGGSLVVAPSITAYYSVTGTSAAGCISSAVVSTVFVNQLPVVTASASNSIICNGATTILNGSGANTYTWSGGVTNGVSFSPVNTATYTVIGTNTVTGCTSTNTAAQGVTVNPLPVVTSAISNSVICEGSTTTLNGGGADTYTWTGGVTDGVAFTPLTSGSYTVTGTSTLTGCSSTNAAVESVTVNLLPIVTAAITNSVICEGFSTTLNGGGADTYTWTGGVTDGVVFTPTVTGSYTVTGTNTLTGCTSTNVAVESVTVNPNPVISAANGAICVNGSYTITPNGASTYTISGGSAIVSPSVTTSYSVTGTSVDGCTGNTAVVTVSVQSSLTVSIAGSNSVCDGNAVSLTANGATTYSWNTGSTSNTIAPTPTVNTTYSVVGSSGSCSDSAIVNITVNANPTVTAVSNTSLICAGQSVSLTASGATTYTWNASITGAAITDTPTTTTTYTVTGEDVNGCTNTVMFTQNVSPCTGIYASNGISSSIRVYPNPSTGMVTVEVESNATIIVLNTLGQVITSGNVIAGKNQIDTKEFANGIYFVKVTQNGTQHTIRLIKE